ESIRSRRFVRGPVTLLSCTRRVAATQHHRAKGRRMKQLRIIPDKCTSCLQCELACSFVQTGTFQPSRSVIRVYVFDEQASYAPYTCFQCNEAWCMTTCPVNAIAIDPKTGA